MDTSTREAEAGDAEARSGPRRSRIFLIATLLFLLPAGTAISAWPESAILLESTPPGAEVAVDGQSAGATPLRLTSRPWPFHGQIEVALPGYHSWAASLDAGFGETRLVEVSLDPLPGRISVTSVPLGALVVLDGREVGQSPVLLTNVASGRHELSLTLANHHRWHGVLELLPGETASQQALLAPLPGPSTQPASAEHQRTEAEQRAGLTPPLAVEPPPALPRGDPSQPVHPIAILIENAPVARPHSGLGAADIVFEAMAEGGISRFMAVYIEGDAPVVGPVRSARHYFVNLAAELGASVVHVGASPLGYVSLKWFGLHSLDETFGQPGFWRSRARPAPHNTYTSLGGARQALDGRGAAPRGSWGGFTFKHPERRYQGRSAERVSLEYRPWDYRVTYQYDPITNHYARFMEDKPHQDAESGSQLQATNVAFLSLESWVIDTEGRLDMTQLGTGPAVYFEDGVAVQGSWSKSSTNDITRFLDEAGNPIRFNPGPIWVQLISPESQVSY